MSVGGVVGAAIGFFVGGPAGAFQGYAIGSTTEALLFPPAGPDGPRLQDRKVQTSEYGRPIPVVYGTDGQQGNVIWAADLIEVEADSGGGKGGSESTVYSYYANFAVAVCEGGANIRLGRIWAGPEKRLIYDGTLLEGEGEIRFYNGAEDQLPDPLIEAAMGVGMTPAYRGTAYVVLEMFPVIKDGNRIPFLTIEVGNVETSVAPEDLGTVWIDQVIKTASTYMVIYHGSYRGVIVRNLSDNTLVSHYVYDLEDWYVEGPDWFHDADRNVLVRLNTGAMEYFTLSLEDGGQDAHPITAAAGADPGPGVTTKHGVYYQGYYIFGAAGAGGTRTTMYFMDPDDHTAAFTYTYDVSTTFDGPLLAPQDAGDYLFGYSTGGELKKYPLAAAQTPETLGTPAVISQITGMKVDPNTGRVWSATLILGILSVRAWDPVSETNFTYAAATSMFILAGDPISFVPGSPNRVIVTGMMFLATDCFVVFDADTPAFISEDHGAYHGTANINTVLYNDVTDRLMAFRYGGWITFSDDSANDPATLNYVGALDNKYLGDADGTADPDGQTLASIVLDLSMRAGLAEEQVDVTDLEDDMVDGYTVGKQMSVRDAITALMGGYFFDAAEIEGVVRFVKRGGALAVEIPDADVGAFEAGTEPSGELETVRRMENELPRRVTVNYISAATNYSVASKHQQRQVGSSGEEAAMECPIVMTDTKAQEVADVTLHGAWAERISYRFTLPRKYSYLTPTDIVGVMGYTIRIEKITDNDGILKIEGKHDDTNIYTPHVVVTETPPPAQEVETTSDVVWELA